MRLLENIRNPQFWGQVLQLALIFFVIFIGLTLIIGHFQEILHGNFAAIYKEEWAEGKWVDYFLLRGAISIVYAIYMTSRRGNFKFR